MNLRVMYALFALAGVGVITGLVLLIIGEKETATVVTFAAVLPLMISTRRLMEGGFRRIVEFTKVIDDPKAVDRVIKLVEGDLADTLTELDRREETAKDLEDRIKHLREIIALTREQANAIGAAMAELQASRARRDLWLGLTLGALLSIPIGIGVNFLTG